MSAGIKQPETKEQGVHERDSTKEKKSNVGNVQKDRRIEENDRGRTMDSGLKAHQHVEDKKDSDGDQDRDSGDQLKRAVQKQIEYYFSRENLITDTYLMSQMDGDQYVPVAVIAGFNQVRRLTADLEVIMEAIKISDALQLDETGHKVKAHSKRCVLLVRGIPQNTEEETVKGLFQRKDECPECTNCEVAHNDSWYIGFDTEEDALKAYRYLREVVIEFNGHPLHVRVKEKVFQRSKQTVPQHFPPVGFGRGMGFQPAGAGPFYQPPPMYMQPVPWVVDPSYNGMVPGPGHNNMHHIRPHSGGGKYHDGGRGGHHPPRHNPHMHQDRQMRGGKSRDDRPPSGRGRRREEDPRSPTYRTHRPPPQNLDLAPGNFPPLPNSRGGPPSQVRSSSADESGNLLADVVKRAQGQTTTGRPIGQSESVFDGELVSPPGNPRPTQRSVSASDQMYKSSQRYQQTQGSSNTGKSAPYNNRSGPPKYTGRQSDSRDQRQGGYTRNRSKFDKKTNLKSSPRSSRHASLPPPPTSDTDKQDLSPVGAEVKVTYAAIAQKKQKVKSPSSSAEEGEDMKLPSDSPTKEDVSQEKHDSSPQPQPVGVSNQQQSSNTSHSKDDLEDLSTAKSS